MGDSPLGRVVDSRRALKEGAAGIERRQRARLADHESGRS